MIVIINHRVVTVATRETLERMADAMRCECGFDNARPWLETDESVRRGWVEKVKRVLAAAEVEP